MENCDKLLYDITVNDSEKAFRLLFDNYYPSLCLFCKRYIDDFDVREDIVQNVFVSIWENRRNIFVNSSVKNYLITSARNGCLNYLRRNNKLVDTDISVVEETPLYGNSSEALFILSELEDLLNEALSKLPLEYQRVYSLSREEGRSNKDIAVEMAISEKTVERYKSRINLHLKHELREYLPFVVCLFPLN